MGDPSFTAEVDLRHELERDSLRGLRSVSRGYGMPLGRVQAEMTGETPKGGLQTNNAFRLHTDRCDVISLMSLRTAPNGGASQDHTVTLKRLRSPDATIQTVNMSDLVQLFQNDLLSSVWSDDPDGPPSFSGIRRNLEHLRRNAKTKM